MAIARKDLKEARAILAIGLATAAARCAYFSVFHAAEAAIFEITNKAAKTHAGVHSEYARLSRDMPELSDAPHAFLATAYRYKQAGDYGFGSAQDITMETSKVAVERAERFVETIAALFDRRDRSKK